MKTVQEIITQITKLTINIKTSYPELYAVLDENPITIPSPEHPSVTIDDLKDYLDSLKQLLKHYKNTHKR